MNAIVGGRRIVTFPALIFTGISSGIGFAITRRDVLQADRQRLSFDQSQNRLYFLLLGDLSACCTNAFTRWNSF